MAERQNIKNDKNSNTLNDIFEDVRKLSLKCEEFEKMCFTDDDNRKRRRNEENPIKNNRMHLPDRHFQARNSLLTDLFEIKEINTIYHVFIVIFTLLLLNVFVSDFADTGKINIGLHTIIKGFRGSHNAFLIWICMQLSTFSLYPAFMIWASITRKFFTTKGPITTLWNLICVLAVFVYQATFITLATKAVIGLNLGPASSMALLMEVVRFMMKAHAFIRSNVSRVFRQQQSKTKSSDESESDDNSKAKIKLRQCLPTFKQFTYFLFAPTLIYRDEYPRTGYIRWRFVFKCFLEVLSVIFILSFLFERFMQPTYSRFGSQFYEVGVKELITSVFNSMLPGLLSFLCGFYCILHSWMNAFAELLRFSDRMFYLDWWNATKFSVYYRSWNSIVHDWLYLYVYKDFYEHVFKRNRPICQFIVFSISAIFHEYILGFTFRFFYPVLFVEFQGIGVLLFFIMKKDLKMIGNCIMWMSLAIGTGLLLSLYHMEYYARENCSFDKENLWNYFIPLSWSCNGLKFSKNWKIQF